MGVEVFIGVASAKKLKRNQAVTWHGDKQVVKREAERSANHTFIVIYRTQSSGVYSWHYLLSPAMPARNLEHMQRIRLRLTVRRRHMFLLN